jgi:hypothetical protein
VSREEDQLVLPLPAFLERVDMHLNPKQISVENRKIILHISQLQVVSDVGHESSRPVQVLQLLDNRRNLEQVDDQVLVVGLVQHQLLQLSGVREVFPLGVCNPEVLDLESERVYVVEAQILCRKGLNYLFPVSFQATQNVLEVQGVKLVQNLQILVGEGNHFSALEMLRKLAKVMEEAAGTQADLVMNTRNLSHLVQEIHDRKRHFYDLQTDCLKNLFQLRYGQSDEIN